MHVQVIFMGMNRALHVYKAVMLRLMEDGHEIAAFAFDKGDGLIVVNCGEPRGWGQRGIRSELREWIVDYLLPDGYSVGDGGDYE